MYVPVFSTAPVYLYSLHRLLLFEHTCSLCDFSTFMWPSLPSSRCVAVYSKTSTSSVILYLCMSWALQSEVHLMRIVIRVILYPPIPACSLKLEVRKCAVQAEVATCDWISRWHEVRQPHCHMCKFESLHRAIPWGIPERLFGIGTATTISTKTFWRL